jgi:hypothetical protein
MNDGHTMKKGYIIITLIAYLLFSFVEREDKEITVFEKIYLHLDRHFYLSGDDIWFKVYLVDAQTNKPRSNSRIVYAELISPESKRLARLILPVDSLGSAVGDFILKSAAVSGKYRIRAYTQWMLNFGDNFVFEKEIEVRNLDGFDIADNMDIKQKKKDIQPVETVINHDDVGIEFFPESGSLIAGVENTVAFKASDWSGIGREVSGGIFNSAGDTVALFASEYLGMGKFTFTPSDGEDYRAFFTPSGVSYSLFATLPEVLYTGFALNITDKDSVFTVGMITNAATFDKYEGKTFLVYFSHSEKPLFEYDIVLNRKLSPVNLPKSIFPAGIIRITLFDEEQKPHCERLVYVENRKRISAEIIPVNDTASTIKIVDNTGAPVRAGLSMSIINSAVPDELFNIESFFWLESEIRGQIESPTAYFDTANRARGRQMDLLLLTQGWRDFVWKRMAEEFDNFHGYEPEKGLRVSGHVKKTTGKKPLPNVNVFMFFPDDRIAGIRFAKTDSSGKYDLGYVDFYGDQYMFVNARSEKNRGTGEIFVDPLCMPEDRFPVTVWTHYKTDTAKYLFEMESSESKDYRLDDTTVLDPVVISGSKLNKHDHLILDREITPKDEKWKALDLYVDGKTQLSGGIFDYRYFDRNGNSMDNRVPPSKISMKEVERITIHRRHEFDWDSSTKSIYTVNVYAKQSKFTVQHYPTRTMVSIPMSWDPRLVQRYFTYESVNRSALTSAVQGYHHARTFYKPKFSNINQIQNHFGTYYWNPNIRTGNNGEVTVYCNPRQQPSGKIRIEGLTDDGIPFVARLK